MTLSEMTLPETTLPDTRLVLSGITKAFGSNQALGGVAVDLRHGEVHAVVGENGAGKSTLMRVLAGHMAADAGRMVLGGQQTRIDRATPGHREGIGFVEQEGGLVAELTGAENLILAEGRGFWSDRRNAGRRIQEVADRFGATVDPDVPVHALSVGERQRLEILIILARGADILILDEPTAALATQDAETLSEIVRGFVSDGGSVFYISHKLHEVKAIADRITVMRRGVVVGHHRSADVTVADLAAEMVGEIDQAGLRRLSQDRDPAPDDDLIEVALGARTQAAHRRSSEPVCVLHNVSAAAPYRGEAALEGLDLRVHAGEVVGVAGVVGSGQSTLAEVLAGLIRPSSGRVELPPGPVAYVPENRHRDAIALSLSIRDNLVLHSHRRPGFRRGPWFNRAVVDRHATEVLAGARVLGAGPEQPVSSLSGGNQQKLVLGRELDEGPALVVAHNPFRGLDVRAIQDVREAVLGACERGAGVVMISPDLDEILQLADRVVVLFGGRIIGEVGADDVDSLGRLMGGVA
ncbi:ATP-binding cassette domain-containing protein [Geodermatophilus sp. DF01-2]|uniref:ABC transporter ATP-binding protein n=1 Tax=Geodermatophilus sp. DF01-2 TaxID=2559610 RepID=UPI0010744646|nr:ATP-binding cassette domain-containing protein [Geodermatophilus sp. DF01_2]TFV56069.1 ATP-binding cassette domain-containing protein [Geodermatophilus sp. DF01_2]